MLDELLLDARIYLAESGWPMAAQMADDRTLINTVHAHFPGGWRAFARLKGRPYGGCLWIAMCDRFGLDYSNRIFWRH